MLLTHRVLQSVKIKVNAETDNWGGFEKGQKREKDQEDRKWQFIYHLNF